MSSFGWRRRRRGKGKRRQRRRQERGNEGMFSIGYMGISQWKTKPRRFGSYPNTTSNMAVLMLLTTEQGGTGQGTTHPMR